MSQIESTGRALSKLTCWCQLSESELTEQLIMATEKNASAVMQGRETSGEQLKIGQIIPELSANQRRR